jgi:transcriptional regulator with XRE-family HTH domain
VSDFGAALRDALRYAQLTQTELAARTPVSTATISRYLVRGENHPLRDTLVAMCRVLGPLPRPLERRLYHSCGFATPAELAADDAALDIIDGPDLAALERERIPAGLV